MRLYVRYSISSVLLCFLTNMRILKFKSKLTIAFFAAVNHLNGPLKKQNFTLTIVNRGNGYETRQSSLLYVFVLFFGLDPAQNTIVVYSVLRN